MRRAAMTGGHAGRRVAIPLLAIGIVLLAVALVGPPYRTCAQFELLR